jgi:hypothetical protein
MTGSGDITDAFDDEGLKRAIEAASEGPWVDPEARFVDPQLVALERRLKMAPLRTYHERRMAELKELADHEGRRPKKNTVRRRAASPATAGFAAEAAAGDGAGFGADAPVTFHESGEAAPAGPQIAPRPMPKRPADHWQYGPPPDTAPEAETKVMSLPPQLTVRQFRSRSDLPAEVGFDNYAPSVFAATLVFTTAATVYGLVAHWHLDLLFRTAGAIAVAGYTWRRFQSDRVRALLIATICYALAFATTDRWDTEEELAALSMGLLIVVAGATMVGVQRDDFSGQA